MRTNMKPKTTGQMKAFMLLGLMMLTSMTAKAAVGDEVASGSCGDNLTWTLTENGKKAYYKQSVKPGVTLTIIGTGEMTGTSFKSQTGLLGTADNVASEKLITDVIIGEGVTSIMSSAFFDCTSLCYITLPSTLTSIGQSAFSNCRSLKTIDIPDGVTQIQYATFSMCDSLRSVSLGKGVTEIADYAFRKCTQLMTVRLKRYKPNDPQPITVFRTGSFSECKSLISIVIPESGWDRYLIDKSGGEALYTCWTSLFIDEKSNNVSTGTAPVYYNNLLRYDRETLFLKGATNEWATWVDNFNRAAPKDAEVYTIRSVENGVVKLQKVTATVTLPEDEREGAGDDGVRALIQAFVPVLIKRPSGEVTHDLKMTFVMGGDITLDNGWYSSSVLFLWGEGYSGSYNTLFPDNFPPRVIPDRMADVPYGYGNIQFYICPLSYSPIGRAEYVQAESVDKDNFIIWGNAGFTSYKRVEHSIGLGTGSMYTLTDDKFCHINNYFGAPPHVCILRTSYGGSTMTLETNDGTSLTLADQSDNSAAIAAANGTTVDARLDGHVFTKDGSWNTLCLPFSMDAAQIADSPLGGACIKTLDSSASSLDASTLSLNFNDATTIEAGQPFIAKWQKPEADLIINSADDWNTFAANVNSGSESYAGKLVRLGQDVEGVTTMVGTEEHPFCGEFDGDGHTLTINLASNEAYCAPFRYVYGARFLNLRVTGTITTTNFYAAGIVATIIGGVNYFNNCESSVVIINNHYDDNPDVTYNYYAGFVSTQLAGSLSFNNCLFNGNFVRDTGNTKNYSGFVGKVFQHIDNLFLTNCLFSLSGEIDESESGNHSFAEWSTVFGPRTVSTNCYYTQKYEEAVPQIGAQAPNTNEELLAILGSRWEIRDGKVKPRLYSAIADPVFKAVTVNGSAPTEVSFPTGGKFAGSYGPFDDASDVLSDANNTGNGAFHAALVTPAPADYFVGWYSDAALTTPATAIPFTANGSATIYTKWVDQLLRLSDTSDNSATIASAVASGLTDNRVVTLCGRTIYTDGYWNTLCLPFSLSAEQIVASPLKGATIKALDGTTSNLIDGTLTLNFTAATDIEAGLPYIIKWKKPEADLVINNAGEWDTFAANITKDNTYEGKLVQLGDNITITTMVGKSGNQGYPFKGTFDGQGHTITANLAGGADDEGTAPFYSIEDATIKNLKVTGTITTQKHRPASFAAIAGGVSTIKNCWSSADLSSTRQNDWVDAGAIVACIEEGKTLNITDCAFTGSVTYDASAHEGGGVVGWARSGATANITRCLYAPSSVTISSNAEPSRIFVNGYTQGNLTKCYYNAAAAATAALSLDIVSQGADASGMSNDALLTALGQQWQIVGTQVLPVISGALEYSNIVDPTFSGVTINNSTTNVVPFAGGQFVGAYSPVAFTANDKSILFLGDANQLYWPNADMTLGACRAHFEISDGNAVREFKLNFDEENEVNGITNTNLTNRTNSDEWFTLDGRKLEKRPTKKGLYLYKDRKVVIQ